MKTVKLVLATVAFMRDFIDGVQHNNLGGVYIGSDLHKRAVAILEGFEALGKI